MVSLCTAISVRKGTIYPHFLCVVSLWTATSVRNRYVLPTLSTVKVRSTHTFSVWSRYGQQHQFVKVQSTYTFYCVVLLCTAISVRKGTVYLHFLLCGLVMYSNISSYRYSLPTLSTVWSCYVQQFQFVKVQSTYTFYCVVLLCTAISVRKGTIYLHFLLSGLVMYSNFS